MILKSQVVTMAALTAMATSFNALVHALLKDCIISPESGAIADRIENGVVPTSV
jgi:hypothetical protein